jgi:chromosome segregation ATPase
VKDVRKYARADGDTSRLRRENSELRDRLREKELELDGAKETIEEMEKSYQKLLDQYERYLFDYSVRIEEVAEAKMAYEAAAERLKQLTRQYQKEAEQWISAMKKEGKAVS